MMKKELLSDDQIDSVSGGWSMTDLSKEDLSDFEKYKADYLKYAKLAMNDPAYQAKADEAERQLDEYWAYLDNKYSFMEKNGLL